MTGPARPAEPAGSVVTTVLAPNPGPMTLEGTNTYVLAEAGGRSVVIDPGPDHPAHRAATVAAAGGPGRCAAVLLTHHHLDHSEGAPALAAALGAPLRAVADGDTVRVDGLLLEVLATPGHSADSVSFWLDAEQVLFTGDTVLGRGTTVVAHPDGELAAYLASLARLAGLPARRILPGHGPVVADPAGWLAHYQQHRGQRLAAVRAAVAAGHRGVDAVVAAVYADTDPVLWPAAALSVAAQLRYLVDRGEVPANAAAGPGAP